jgi:hypothetical protein
MDDPETPHSVLVANPPNLPTPPAIADSDKDEQKWVVAAHA